MKNRTKILSYYVFSAAGIALLLLVVNFMVIITWMVESSSISRKDYNVSQLSDELKLQAGSYQFPEDLNEVVETQYQWAMLIDQTGNVIWSLSLPEDVPRTYAFSDVARFTRWYLSDYPVRVWTRDDGIFVLGSPKGSVWKYGFELPHATLKHTLFLIPMVLILNTAIAILMALFFGIRLFRNLTPLLNGIEEMSESRSVSLPEKGLLSELAASINKTSKKLADQEAALKQRDTARTTWIAGVSHDIRTPLSMVMGYASQLEEDPELSLENQAQAGIIRHQSERIKLLVNDLNLTSKLAYNMQPVRKTAIALPALLRDVIASLINSGVSSDYPIELKIDESAQNSVAQGDEALLKRAVFNLVDNSITHNPEGCRIQISLSRNANACILAISDDGSGFPDRVLKRLTHSEKLNELETHGLGLTLVRQIIKAHNGTTEFYNLSQGGCKIVALLPLYRGIKNSDSI